MHAVSRSSRVIERECLEDIAFRVIAVNQQPDHATIARFIRRHEDALAGIFGDELAVECRANAEYEHYRAHARDSRGRRLGARPKSFVPPATPAASINVSDPDSRLLKAPKGFVQGYNAQVVTNENQIVIAAEITVDSPDF